MSRGRLRRKVEKAQRHAPPRERTAVVPPVVARRAERVERLTYTRTQAAEALGVSRSTFNRRVLPYVDTIEMPWGTRLIPVDELDRLLAERRRPAQPRPQPRNRDARQPFRRSWSSTTAQNTRRESAWAKSPATSTPTR